MTSAEKRQQQHREHIRCAHMKHWRGNKTLQRKRPGRMVGRKRRLMCVRWFISFFKHENWEEQEKKHRQHETEKKTAIVRSSINNSIHTIVEWNRVSNRAMRIRIAIYFKVFVLYCVCRGQGVKQEKHSTTIISNTRTEKLKQTPYD